VLPALRLLFFAIAQNSSSNCLHTIIEERYNIWILDDLPFLIYFARLSELMPSNFLGRLSSQYWAAWKPAWPSKTAYIEWISPYCIFSRWTNYKEVNMKLLNNLLDPPELSWMGLCASLLRNIHPTHLCQVPQAVRSLLRGRHFYEAKVPLEY
jgi:hypothetical protein